MLKLAKLALLPLCLAALSAPAHAQNGSSSGDSKLDAILDSGGFYFERRDAILAAGWKPVVNQACRDDVYGAPSVQPAAGQFDLCAVLPELDSCSGQGYCLMIFENKAGLTVRITTYGSYGDDWNDPDRDAMFVNGWEGES